MCWGEGKIFDEMWCDEDWIQDGGVNDLDKERLCEL
jgi:hypothetical protein